MKRLLSVFAIFTVLAVSGIASATTIQEVGVIGGSIYASFGSTINNNQPLWVAAGYYQLRIDGGASPVNGFCVDPAWAPSQPNNTYAFSSITDPSSKYARAAFLFSQINSSNNNSFTAEAIQIAIWKVVISGFNWVNSTDPANSTLASLVDQYYTAAMAADLSQFDLNQYMLLVSPGTGQSYGYGAQDYIVRNPNAPVPEPATMLLLGSGLAGIAAFRRRSKK